MIRSVKIIEKRDKEIKRKYTVKIMFENEND